MLGACGCGGQDDRRGRVEELAAVVLADAEDVQTEEIAVTVAASRGRAVKGFAIEFGCPSGSVQEVLRWLSSVDAEGRAPDQLMTIQTRGG